MALVGIGIDHLDLAILDINEAIRRFTGSSEKHSRRIHHDLARGAQRLDMRRSERRALHLAQIVADRFHVFYHPVGLARVAWPNDHCGPKSSNPLPLPLRLANSPRAFSCS